jgi:hypothetical protein
VRFFLDLPTCVRQSPIATRAFWQLPIFLADAAAAPKPFSPEIIKTQTPTLALRPQCDKTKMHFAVQHTRCRD